MDIFKRRLDQLLGFVVHALMVLLLIVTAAQVFWRYVLNSPIAWSEELARYIFVWLVFLAGAIAFRDCKHMAVDLLTPFLPPSAKKVQAAVVKLLLGGFLLVILLISPEIITITMDQPSASLSIPIGLVYMAFPVSAVIMLVYLVLDIAACVQCKK